MQNYKWDVWKNLSSNLDRLYDRKAMSNSVRDNVLSPEECYKWLKSDEDLKLDIVEINCNSSKSYGAGRIGRYFFIEYGAELLASIMFMHYANEAMKWSDTDKPEILLCKDVTINEDGINYIEVPEKNMEEWRDKKCEEYLKFVQSLSSDKQDKLEAFLAPHTVYNFKYAFPTGKVLRAEISENMTYGEFKKLMMDVFHVRPWHIRFKWTKENQEERDTKLLSEMRITSGTIVVAEDALLDELDRRFHDVCHNFMKWRYMKRQWQKIPYDVRMNQVDNLPNFWIALLEKMLE